MQDDIKMILNKIREYQNPCISEAGGWRIGEFHPDEDKWLEDGFLHYIYSPLAEEQIVKAERKIGQVFPASLRKLLSYSNGLNIFCTSIIIQGSLSGDGLQPISLEYGNTIDLPRDATGKEVVDDKHVYFGSYSFDGSDIKINILSGEVIHEEKDKFGSEIRKWKSLEIFLRDEFERMSLIYKACHGKISMFEPISPYL